MKNIPDIFGKSPSTLFMTFQKVRKTEFLWPIEWPFVIRVLLNAGVFREIPRSITESARAHFAEITRPNIITLLRDRTFECTNIVWSTWNRLRWVSTLTVRALKAWLSLTRKTEINYWVRIRKVPSSNSTLEISLSLLKHKLRAKRHNSKLLLKARARYRINILLNYHYDYFIVKLNDQSQNAFL